MRDFRDAKAMARTLRAALAAKGFNITVSQSLELIAEAFGMADWNTLAAAIRAQAAAPREQVATPPPLRHRFAAAPGAAFCHALELTLHRALGYANQRSHEYTTLEHLLLALIDDVDALAVMMACNADLGALKKNLVGYIDDELKDLATARGGDDTKPTAGFQRVVQRAVIQGQGSGRDAEITGAHVLVGIFAERESHAAWFLQEQGIHRDDAMSVIGHGTIKGGGS